MNVTGDVGPQVLKFPFDALKIDDAWALWEPRSFTWWAHRLEQRVWAEPARSSYDHDVVRVHAATALLRGVPDTADVRARLAAVNRFMSLGALVPSRPGDRIILHSAARFHVQNVAWLQPCFWSRSASRWRTPTSRPTGSPASSAASPMFPCTRDQAHGASPTRSSASSRR